MRARPALGSGSRLWTELWAYRWEQHVRLWEELTPVPYCCSLRIVDSYAGFEGDAPVLSCLWKRALEGQRLDADLPIYCNGKLWAFIDQGEDAQVRAWLGDPAGMDAYYAEQRASLRPGTFARLHLNHWQSGEEAFVTAETYDQSVRRDLRPVVSDSYLPIFVGVDAATRRDCAAVVAVARVKDGEEVRYRLVRHRIWTVKRGATLDLEETIEAFVLELARSFRVRSVRYDPMQMVRSAQTLSKRGIRMEAFDQTSGHLTEAGQNLYDLMNARQLDLYPDKELRRHARTPWRSTRAAGGAWRRRRRRTRSTGARRRRLLLWRRCRHRAASSRSRSRRARFRGRAPASRSRVGADLSSRCSRTGMSICRGCVGRLGCRIGSGGSTGG